MKGDNIPETDTISRYCPYSKISEITGKPLGVAFRIKNKDLETENPHISVNWLEYFEKKSRKGQIDEIKNILSKKMIIGSQSKLAIFKVTSIHEHIKNSGFFLRILHWPDQTDYYDDPSHAGIFDIESDPDIIADIITQVEFEMVPAKG